MNIIYELPEIRFLLEFGSSQYFNAPLNEENELPLKNKEEVEAALNISHNIGVLLMSRTMLDEKKDKKEIEDVETSMLNIKNYMNKDFSILLKELRIFYKKCMFKKPMCKKTPSSKTFKKNEEGDGFDMMCNRIVS